MRELADVSAGIAAMFASESETFWVNVTNAALGFLVLVLCLVVVWAATQEIISPKHGRMI